MTNVGQNPVMLPCFFVSKTDPDVNISGITEYKLIFPNCGSLMSNIDRFHDDSLQNEKQYFIINKT